MFIDAFKRVFSAVRKKSRLMLVIFIITVVLVLVSIIAGNTLLSIVNLLAFVLSVGIANVYIEAINGRDLSFGQLYEAISDRPKRIAGGLCWQVLWLLIWSLVSSVVAYFAYLIPAVISVAINAPQEFNDINFVPIIIFGIIAFVIGGALFASKAYSYSLVTYILAAEPEVSATEALRLSKKRTKGKKRWLFLFDVIMFFPLALLLVGVYALGMPHLFMTGVNILTFEQYMAFSYAMNALRGVYLVLYYSLFVILRGLYIAAVYEKTADAKVTSAPVCEEVACAPDAATVAEIAEATSEAEDAPDDSADTDA